MFDLFKSHTPKPANAPRKVAAEPAPPKAEPPLPAEAKPAAENEAAAQPGEVGGPKGLEPTRYGDWERKGICYDF